MRNSQIFNILNWLRHLEAISTISDLPATIHIRADNRQQLKTAISPAPTTTLWTQTSIKPLSIRTSRTSDASKTVNLKFCPSTTQQKANRGPTSRSHRICIRRCRICERRRKLSCRQLIKL
jgi:hypothetical protein